MLSPNSLHEHAHGVFLAGRTTVRPLGAATGALGSNHEDPENRDGHRGADDAELHLKDTKRLEFPRP